ncbi:MAG: TetR/AcrR family transcriptional regulator [Bryobacteraceae bacterium]|jgi:AcrR family transcriptional regulator
MSDTRDRILDAAERLFGEQGYAATSLRHIIAEAGVNLAAIHYHFGSKEELLEELVARVADPVNAARTALLDRFEAETGGAPVAVEKILEGFLRPAAEMGHKHPGSVKLMGRLYGEGLMPSLVERHFKPTGKRFVNALRRALPGIPDQEFFWRIDFMIGAMAHAMIRTQAIGQVLRTNGAGSGETGEASAPAVPAGRLASLIAFLSAGFRAAVPKTEEIEVRK